ncbi:pyrroline-5-carboxylate reductase-like [Tribolium madens]|uniref:pyrroline-5-carboxylate reductase-like n=1 Tax=Tribolium madens TaxID=41895 RepID=UPI001CF73FE6|nr:pyrroline-5-carboxylate reductase-like [Tribolium madens]
MILFDALIKIPKNNNVFQCFKNALNSKTFCTTTTIKIKKKIGFIGDGNMAKALCKSIERRGLINYSQVYVSSPYIKNLNVWKELGANITTDNTEVAQKSDIVFLAVKPHMLSEILDKIIKDATASPISNKLFVSILAGITLRELEEKTKVFQGSRVIRVMPNTPVVVGEGYTAYCPGQNVTEEDLSIIKSILEVTGSCQLLPEKMINAVGAISSSGPAFVYLFIEALSDGGVRMGLHREMSTKIAAQTVMGAAKMVLETSKHMGTLKDEVCSAGGTTIAGVHELEKGGVRGSVMNAVEAAAKRADELAK